MAEIMKRHLQLWIEDQEIYKIGRCDSVKQERRVKGHQSQEQDFGDLQQRRRVRKTIAAKNIQLVGNTADTNTTDSHFYSPGKTTQVFALAPPGLQYIAADTTNYYFLF